MRSQYSGHLTSYNQWEASILVTWLLNKLLQSYNKLWEAGILVTWPLTRPDIPRLAEVADSPPRAAVEEESGVLSDEKFEDFKIFINNLFTTEHVQQVGVQQLLTFKLFISQKLDSTLPLPVSALLLCPLSHQLPDLTPSPPLLLHSITPSGVSGPYPRGGELSRHQTWSLWWRGSNAGFREDGTR